MNIIMKCKFGSHLYGLNTPNSDLDIKGVYLPTIEQIILGDYENIVDFSTNKNGSKNSKDDVDESYYALPFFLEKLLDGGIAEMDMLHARGECLLQTSDIWEELYENRSKTYSKNQLSYMSYIRKQVSKYGLKGSRLEVAERFQEYCHYRLSQGKTRLFEFEETPELEYEKKPKIKIFKDEPNPNEPPIEGEMAGFIIGKNDQVFYQIVGKKFQHNTLVTEALKSIDSFIESYGQRMIDAKDGKNIDWKAVSHAVRVCYQLIEIYTEGDITFPLKHRDFILSVKKGELNLLNDVAPKIEVLIELVEDLRVNSKYNDVPDRDFFKHWYIDLVKENM